MPEPQSSIGHQLPPRSPARRLEPTTTAQTSLDHEIFALDAAFDEAIQRVNDATKLFIESIDHAKGLIENTTTEVEVVTIVIRPPGQKSNPWRRLVGGMRNDPQP